MVDRISIELNADEALVLFEFLSRFSESDKLEIADNAEARVLWDMLCDLETILVEPFSEEYPRLLEIARERLRDKV